MVDSVELANACRVIVEEYKTDKDFHDAFIQSLKSATKDSARECVMCLDDMSDMFSYETYYRRVADKLLGIE